MIFSDNSFRQASWFFLLQDSHSSPELLDNLEQSVPLVFQLHTVDEIAGQVDAALCQVIHHNLVLAERGVAVPVGCRCQQLDLRPRQG